MVKTLSSLFVVATVSIFAQSAKQVPAAVDLIFSYDEAGNQVLRRPPLPKITEVHSLERGKAAVAEPDPFWLQVHLYPVPVKSTLTIAWNQEVDELIESVTLYQHSSLVNLFQKKNMPALNRELHIDMSRFYMGVYILTFTLKDGRTLSKNITKL